jgi:hypothetical protein
MAWAGIAVVIAGLVFGGTTVGLRNGERESDALSAP